MRSLPAESIRLVPNLKHPDSPTSESKASTIRELKSLKSKLEQEERQRTTEHEQILAKAYEEGKTLAYREHRHAIAKSELSQVYLLPKLIQHLIPRIENVVRLVCSEVVVSELTVNRENLLSRISRFFVQNPSIDNMKITLPSEVSEQECAQLKTQITNSFGIEPQLTISNGIKLGQIKIEDDVGVYLIDAQLQLDELFDLIEKSPNVYEQIYQSIIIEELCNIVKE